MRNTSNVCAKHLSYALLFLWLCSTLGCQPAARSLAGANRAATTAPLQMGEVLAITPVTLQNNVNQRNFETFVSNQFQRAWHEHLPEARMVLFKGDRGVRKGEYLEIWRFDTVVRRNHFYPVADAPDNPAAEEVLAPVMPVLERYNQHVQGPRRYTDYMLIGRADLEPDLPSFEVIALREIRVRPGMIERFEAFVREDLHQAWTHHVPGMRTFILRGDRGEQTGEYLHVFTFETVEARNRYFPTEGEGGSEAYEQAVRPINDLNLHPEEYAEIMGDYTDYVIVR